MTARLRISIVTILGVQIGFIADEHDGDLVIGVVFGLVEPLHDVVEGVPVGYVVDEHHPDRPSVVRAGDRLERLLAGLHLLYRYGVPDLEFDLLVVNVDHLRTELDADCGVVVELEFLLKELQQDARLAHA